MDFLKYAHKEILINALYDMVKSEAQRIIDHRVLSPNTLEEIMVSHMREFNDSNDMSEKVHILGRLHTKLKDLSLPGDGPEAPATTNTPEVEPAFAAPEVDEMLQVKEAINVIERLLEKVAYDLGKNGKHAAAFKVERKLQEISKMV